MNAQRKTTNRMLPLPQAAFDIKTRVTAEGLGKECHSYKPLPTRFRRDSFDYLRIVREGDAAIYEQRWTGCEKPRLCYEVIRIRRRQGFAIGGKFVPPAEVYPRSEQWGELGWTVQDKEFAFNKLREIIISQQNESANPVKKTPIQNTKRCSETKELRGDVKIRRDG